MSTTVRHPKTSAALDLCIRPLKPRMVASETGESREARDARVVVVTTW